MPKITGVDITNITKRSGVSSLSKVTGVSLSLGGGGGGGAPSPTYAISVSPTTLTEGDTFTITVTTTNVADGTQLAVNIGAGVNAFDFTPAASGKLVTIQNNTATTTYVTAVDGDAAETFSFELQQGFSPYGIVATSATCTINPAPSTGATTIETGNLIHRWDPSNTNSYSGTGTAVTDLVSGGTNLTLNNGATFSSSGGIKRFVLDGVNDDIGNTTLTAPPTNLQFQFSNTFSKGIWIYPHFSNSDGFGVFMGSMNSASPYEGSSLINGAPSSRLTPRLWLRTNVYNYMMITMGGALTQNAWQYLVVTFSGSYSSTATKFYLNGSEVTGTSSNIVGTDNGIPYNNTLFRIGSRKSANAFLDGEVGEVHYYSDVLTASEVLSNYNATKANYGL